MSIASVDEIKEYLDSMIEHYKDVNDPILLERRKTYKDLKLVIFGEEDEEHSYYNEKFY